MPSRSLAPLNDPSKMVLFFGTLKIMHIRFFFQIQGEEEETKGTFSLFQFFFLPAKAIIVCFFLFLANH